MISVCFQGKPFNITAIQVYSPTTIAEEAEVEQSYDDLQDLLELTPKETCPFHHRGLECKSRKSRDTWGVWPWWTKWSKAKANRVFPREHTGHSKHSLPTTQEKTLHIDIIDGQYQNQIDYILCSQRWRSSIQLAKTRPGADCGTDHELLIAKFRLKLKKVGKTIRPFRYDLNQIPYDYTVEVTNRFKGLDLIDRMPEELWMGIRNMEQRRWSKLSPRKTNAKGKLVA